jgi:hypothetical protein
MNIGDRNVTAYDEERLGDLLSALPPAPPAWVKAAQGLPFIHARVDEIVARAEQDDDYRRRVVADPQTALQEADVVAHADAVEILRRELDK